MSLSNYQPIPFNVWLAENKADLEKEFAEPCSLDRMQSCEECNGDGYVECDLGHSHDCEECDGEGKKFLTDEELFYEYASDMYREQVDRDKKVVKRYEQGSLCL